MNKLVTLERTRLWENKVWTDQFVQTIEGDSEELLRNAVADYLSTEEGESALEACSYDFNWGDAVICVSQLDWKKYGLQLVYEGDEVSVSSFETVRVDQDELLCKTK